MFTRQRRRTTILINRRHFKILHPIPHRRHPADRNHQRPARPDRTPTFHIHPIQQRTHHTRRHPHINRDRQLFIRIQNTLKRTRQTRKHAFHLRTILHLTSDPRRFKPHRKHIRYRNPFPTTFNRRIPKITQHHQQLTFPPSNKITRHHFRPHPPPRHPTKRGRHTKRSEPTHPQHHNQQHAQRAHAHAQQTDHHHGPPPTERPCDLAVWPCDLAVWPCDLAVWARIAVRMSRPLMSFPSCVGRRLDIRSGAPSTYPALLSALLSARSMQNCTLRPDHAQTTNFYL